MRDTIQGPKLAPAPSPGRNQAVSRGPSTWMGVGYPCGRIHHTLQHVSKRQNWHAARREFLEETQSRDLGVAAAASIHTKTIFRAMC